MIIIPSSVARAPLEQLALLHVAPSGRIASNAHARNAYGTVAQDLVCAALSLRTIPIDGRCAICPDAEGRDGALYEIKSVRHSGKLVIYDWRIEKEQTLPALHYALLLHRARRCRSIEALLYAFSCSLEIWVLPAAVIHRAALACPLRRLFKLSLDPRNGYSRKGYNRGYRNVPLASLRPERAVELRFCCYDRAFTAILRS